jgi:mono/diheme cytochrome c family protein
LQGEEMKRAIAWIAAVLFGGIVLSSPALAKKKIDGQNVFKQHCASCHAGGGNLVDEKHPIAGSKELANIATFKAYLSAPPGHMPFYQDVVNDEETLKALHKYCESLKKQPMKTVFNDFKLAPDIGVVSQQISLDAKESTHASDSQ